MKIDINTTTGFYAEQTYDAQNDVVNVQGLNIKNYVFDDSWDDMQGVIHGAEGTGKSGLTYEGYRDTGFNLDFFRHDQDDELNMVYQMSHMWNTTTAVWPHIHVIPMSSGSGDVYFEYSYAWVPRGEILPLSSSWTVGHSTVSFTADDRFKHSIVSFNSGISPPATAGASTMFLIKMKRLGTHPSDTYSTGKDAGGGLTAAANLAILAADLHYQKIQAGTNTQFY
jgi:hypothetical protein